MSPNFNRIGYLLDAIKNHNSDDCLIWPFAASSTHYGFCRLGDKTVSTHRLSFYFTHGRWPNPVARHTCDNPPCFNPRHIIEGTSYDNTADMVSKLRHCHGGQVNTVKLSEDDVREIRATYRRGLGAMLAERYGVTNANISYIARRKTWRHVI